MGLADQGREILGTQPKVAIEGSSEVGAEVQVEVEARASEDGCHRHRDRGGHPQPDR